MRGVGTTSGAVTVVNALPTGVGCAVALALPVRAEIELRPSTDAHSHKIQLDRASDTALVRQTLDAGLSRFAPGRVFSGELRISSEVPAGRGLKSSSAVGTAVLRALASALHQSRPDPELARLAADVAQEIGLSATGAYDDCLASLQGGLVLTDNTHRTPLRSAPFDLSLRVVLWIPPESHLPSASWLPRFRSEAAAGRTVVERARSGNWAEAMTLNTELVERVMGYDYRGLRAELRRQGAVMCGVSGMGPTVAALVPALAVERVAAQFPADRGEVRSVDIRRGETLPAEGS
ncbi:MAG TPA: shikimate kinase [Thermoplasmata archaeon]|nr:shikimate kinase [Thermoplasmata archaeon]